MGAAVTWEYVDQFGIDRVQALENVDSEPSAFQLEDPEFERMGLKELSNTLVDIQTDHLSLIERQTELLLKDPPSRELQTMISDEVSCTPPIESAISTGVLREPPDILPDSDVPMLVCASADEKWRGPASVEHVAELVPDSRFKPFEESGHRITIEEPERFNQVVSEFVDSIGCRRALHSARRF